MGTVFTEGRHATEGILSEASGNRSRENAVIVSGAGKIEPGHVLGRLTASGKYTPSPATGADGSESGVAIALYGCDATSADQKIAIIRRDAEWKVGDLVYHSTVNDDTKKLAKQTQLATQGIIAR